MVKNKEQEDYNKERIIDINLVIKLMEDYQLSSELFTDKGRGYLEGLASQTDEIKFVSKDKYDKLVIKYKKLKNRKFYCKYL